MALAAVGVALFSFSLPATKLAVDGLSPWFVAFGRAAVAAVLSTFVLWASRSRLPTREQWQRLVIVAVGIVVGFPALTSLALRHVGSAHGGVVIALLPAGTAAWAVLRANERPSFGFWVAALAGLAAVVGFIFIQGIGHAGGADFELLLATAVCSLGYAEGGALSRELGGPQTVCWALVLSAPLTFAVALVAAPYTGHPGTGAWLGFAYVSTVSMFLGFFFWYAGLARGGVAKAGQIQLLQPLLTLVLAGLVLGEHVSLLTVACAVAVLASVAATQRARVERRRPDVMEKLVVCAGGETGTLGVMGSSASKSPTVSLSDGGAIPQLGFGVFQVPPEDTAEVASRALLAGYRHIDTAAAYGNEAGVGQAIHAVGMDRDEVFITTKCFNDDHGYEQAKRALKASLDRLEVDYVDLYLIHWPVPAHDKFVETWKAFIEMQAQGLARAIGVSNFQPAHLERVIKETGVTPAVNQVELHPRFQQAGLRHEHAELGIVTEAWSPLAQGQVLEDPAITQIADAYEKTTGQVVIRWHLQLGNVVIPKSVTPERIVENFDVFDFRLSDDEMAAIEALDAGDRIGPDPDTFIRP